MAADTPVWIEVRCNEYAMRDASPHIPFAPEEIAADAAACRDAGAAVLHYHGRNEDGSPCHEPVVYGETIRRV